QLIGKLLGKGQRQTGLTGGTIDHQKNISRPSGRSFQFGLDLQGKELLAILLRISQHSFFAELRMGQVFLEAFDLARGAAVGNRKRSFFAAVTANVRPGDNRRHAQKAGDNPKSVVTGHWSRPLVKKETETPASERPVYCPMTRIVNSLK